MVRITTGKSDSLDEILTKHWGKISPFSEAMGRYWKNSLPQRITDQRNVHALAGRVAETSFYDTLIAENYQLTKDIVCCHPADFTALIAQLEALHAQLGLVSSTANVDNFGYELLNEVFTYSNWRTSYASMELLKWLGIQVCVYCNMDLVWEDSERDLAIVSYDHFFDKSSYPYLALSFYNLIPACQPCNQNYKHMRPFSLATHYHPYLDNYNESNVFQHDYVDDDTPYRVNIFNHSGNQKSVLFNADLGLENRYNQDNIKKNARSIYKISQRYPGSKKNQLVSDWGLVDIHQVEKSICEEEDIPFNESTILNHQYGKLKRDFALHSHIFGSDNPLL